MSKPNYDQLLNVYKNFDDTKMLASALSGIAKEEDYNISLGDQYNLMEAKTSLVGLDSLCRDLLKALKKAESELKSAKSNGD